MKVKEDLPSGTAVGADELWRVAWTYIRTVVDTVREPFLILDEKLRVISANKTFYSFFRVKQGSTENELVYDLGNGQWNIPRLRSLLEEILPKNTFFEGFEVEHTFPVIGKKIMMLNARRIHTSHEEIPIILLAMEDITTQKEFENEKKTYTKRLELEVDKRTSELKTRVKELEQINKSMVNRELKMIELKDELTKFRNAK